MKKILLYLIILLASLQMYSQTVAITESAGWLESAYVKWQPVSGAQSYNVYYSGNGITDQKIDNQLIRSYGTYFRADVMGISAGTYTITVKAVIDGVEAATTTTQNITVLAHDRNGFAFQGGRIPGGYNIDGTPKPNAVIIYVTQNTKNTVSLIVTGANSNPCIGIQNILYGFKKGIDTRPLIVRLIGNITDMDVMEGGDIVIENKNNASGSITFEGVGNDAVCNGWGVRLKSASNIEVRNLATMNVNSTAGDDFGLQQDNDHVWVHNNEMFYGNAGSDADQIKGDGALDNKGSTYCTFSYNHFWDSGKCSLLGLSENTTQGLYVTYHHNWFDHSDSRHPRVRFYSAHIYNNYYDGVSKYGAGSTMGSSLFVENNYFRNSKRPMMISMQGTDVWSNAKQANDPGNVGTFSKEDGGIIKAFNNTFDADIATNDMRFVAYADPNPLYNIAGKISSTIDFDAYLATNRGEQVPGFVKSYAGANAYNNFDTDAALYVNSLIPDSPEVAKAKVIQYAGRTGGGDFQWTFNNNVDDTSYAVITPLKAAITNYTTTLVAVQGESAAATSSQTLTSTTNNNQSVVSGTAIGTIVFTWGGDATDATVTGLPVSGITFVKDATAKTITISGTPTANVIYSIATTGAVGTPATGSGTITVVTPGAPTGSEIHNFTVSGKTSSFYAITGNMNSTAGTQTYDGLTLTARIKIESATVINYTTTAVSTLTLVFDNTFVGKVKVNDVSYTASAGIVVIPSLPAAAYSITKGDTANLFYIKTVYDTPELIIPIISNFTVANKVVGDQSFTLTAPTTNSDGVFSYSSSDTNVATISGSTLTIVGAGTTTITANQAVTSTYDAGSISATLTVSAAVVNEKPDVWDFGAQQLDATLYNNKLDETTINGWYSSTIVPGTTAITMPVSFTVGCLTWVGNTSDRLRTVNTNLTRFDVNVAGVTDYNGRVYCNGTPALSSGVPTNRFMRIALEKDDEVTIIARTDAAGGILKFVDENDPTLQSDEVSVTAVDATTTQAVFVAKNTSSFKIYSANGKLSFYRISRKPATATVPLTVPTISNFVVADKKVGDESFALVAPATNSDGVFSYNSSDANVATISGNTVTIIGAGTTTITANQTATSTYAEGSISATLMVAVANPVPTISNFTVVNKVVGDQSFTLTAPVTNSDGVFSYTSSDTSVATISGNTVTIVGEGTTTITANQAATSTYAEGSISATLTVSAAAVVNEKPDVWDFGAQQLDATLYNNKLDAAAINAWYPSAYVVGTASTSYVMPALFTAGDLSWVGGSNDRLRTNNTALTRYDSNVGPGATAGYTGRIYINGSAQAGRYLSFNLNENDELTVIANSDAAGMLNFVYLADPLVQSDLAATTTTTTEYKFVAKKTGVYKIYDQVNKPSYYRIIRKLAALVAVSGAIDVANAVDIPSGYTVDFTNEAGKTWSAVVANGKYNVMLPAGYTYTLSVGSANGYLITSGDTFTVALEANVHDIAITKITLYTVTGNVTGLGADISNLSLKYTSNPASNSTYVPAAVVNTTTGQYSVKLESGVQYTVSGTGVNEYEILVNTITVSANTTADVAFTLKPQYKVTITSPSLNEVQLAKLGLKFTNLNETGVSYTFTDINNINLRNGVYSIATSGLDEYPVELALTSNLTILNTAISKELIFKPVTNWSFDDKVISNGTTSYKGMLFTGAVANEIAKGHLNAGAGSTVSVPVSPNQKVTVTYYYAANFSIQGGAAVTTNSNSTGLFEKVDYVYTGTTPGNVLIAVNGTTYFTDINVDLIVPYTSVVTVGMDKDYQTINEALKAISKMVRTTNQRVTVVIDPGNYEEMIVVNSANVTFKNAASKPSIALKNKGVDIDANAVRITSYYGYGYSYYSQGNDNKWNAEILAINKVNNSYKYENVSGTTNGSYWNATAVIAANGFEANDIIFENSFNQYVSKKESQDKVVMWTVGNKGQRPTDFGNTAVQNRSFVERAAAIGIPNGVDKTVLKNCRVVGRQDSFFGGVGSRVVVYKGAVMGAVDYIFGGMIGVFYKTDFVMNVSDVAGDASYLTAPQQSSGRGFLLYECKVTSAEPGVETASTYRAKPGYFGRPWSANTSEVVLYKTKIETSNFPGSEGLSLIAPAGWTSSLGGTSDNIYEFGTIEVSGVDNSSNRVSWSKMISTPALTDGSAITTFNFTKGNDGWDPIPDLETIVSLPADNFSVLVNSATCNGANNGAITVSSKEKTLIYNVKINTNNHVLNSENEYTKTLSNLSAGVYEICFSTASIPNYVQCYEVKIEEPEKIVISSFVSKNSNTVKLTMRGASQYKVTLNGVDETVTGNNYTAVLKTGTNTISVSTDLECQGVFNETIFLSEGIQYFPNPTSGVVQVYLAGEDNEVNVRIFDFAGNKISESTKSVAENRNFQLELSSYMDGIYLIQLEGKTISKTFKIVKR